MSDNFCLNTGECECFVLQKEVNGHHLCYEYDCLTDSFWFNCMSCNVTEPITDADRESIEGVFRFSRIHAGSV